MVDASAQEADLVRVRIPSRAPRSYSIKALHVIGNDETEERYLLGAPNFCPLSLVEIIQRYER